VGCCCPVGRSLHLGLELGLGLQAGGRGVEAPWRGASGVQPWQARAVVALLVVLAALGGYLQGMPEYHGAERERGICPAPLGRRQLGDADFHSLQLMPQHTQKISL